MNRICLGSSDRAIRQPYWCPFVKGLKFVYYISVDEVV